MGGQLSCNGGMRDCETTLLSQPYSSNPTQQKNKEGLELCFEDAIASRLE